MSDFPPITVQVDSLLRFRAADAPAWFVKAVLRAFSYENPEFAKRQYSGRGTWGVPPKVRTAELTKAGVVRLWRGSAKRLREVALEAGIDLRFVDRRLRLPEISTSVGTLTARANQAPAVAAMLKKEQGIVRGGTGVGKCLGRGTLVLMADGELRCVEEIREGDELMGPDSKPRRVLSTSRGEGPLYMVVPKKGEPWVCNDAHILSLVASGSTAGLVVDETYNVSVNEYLCLSKSQRHVLKLWSTGVEFEPPMPVPLRPYFLGIWLGDGRFDSPVICKDEVEIRDAVLEEALDWGLQAVRYKSPGRHAAWAVSSSGGRPNLLNGVLDEARVNGEKRIPIAFLRSTRENRLELLAGLIDTDGYYNGCFEITTKYAGLADDLCFLGRSLGFRVTRRTKDVRLDGWSAARTYHRLLLSGDLSVVPTRIARKTASPRLQKKNVLRTGFSLVPLDVGDYFGFTIDGDGLFLLGDFTVTHNTEVALLAAIASRQPTLIIVWNSALLKQWVKRIEKYGILPASKIGLIGKGKRTLGPITVGMVQTLARGAAAEAAQLFGCVILDECQRCPATTYAAVLNQFPARYRFGMTADERRRDGNEFKCYDALGEVLTTIESNETTVAPTIKVVPTSYRDDDYENDKNFSKFVDRLLADPDRRALVADRVRSQLEAGRKILLFTERKGDAIAWAREVRTWGFRGVCLVGSAKNRAQTEWVDKAIAQAEIGGVDFAAATTFGDVGLDLRAMDTAFVTVPLQKNIQRVEQMIGRVVRPYEGKDEARVFYFWDRYIDGIGRKDGWASFGTSELRKRWPNAVEIMEEA